MVVALMWEMEHLIRHYGDNTDRAMDVLSVISPWLVTFVVLLLARRFFQVSVGVKEVARLAQRTTPPSPGARRCGAVSAGCCGLVFTDRQG